MKRGLGPNGPATLGDRTESPLRLLAPAPPVKTGKRKPPPAPSLQMDLFPVEKLR